MLSRFIASTCSAILMVLCVVSTPSCEAAQLHAIIIADTSAPSNAIENIFDLTNVSNEVHQIASYTGMTLNEKTFYGSDVTIDKIYSAINDLNVESDDTVLLYINMTGFRTESKENNEFPYLFFPYSNEGFDVSDFHQLIRQKQPRLFLSITESSNFYAEVDEIPIVNKKFFWKSNDDEFKTKNYQKLFLESQGEILISSTSPGGFVYYYPEKGSVYTKIFLEMLQEAVKLEAPVEWKPLLKKISVTVQMAMNINGFVQYPHYEVDLNN